MPSREWQAASSSSSRRVRARGRCSAARRSPALCPREARGRRAVLVWPAALARPRPALASGPPGRSRVQPCALGVPAAREVVRSFPTPPGGRSRKPWLSGTPIRVCRGTIPRPGHARQKSSGEHEVVYGLSGLARRGADPAPVAGAPREWAGARAAADGSAVAGGRLRVSLLGELTRFFAYLCTGRAGVPAR